MIPSISKGTLLRQQYLIQEVLGRDQFSRTYLALDLERSRELCLLREIAAPYHDKFLFERLKALFQQEASNFYKIQHPQLPRFWSIFEEGQHLFLVQDFVEGQTYCSLLNQRQQQGQAFSQQEVLDFLVHLLPVLEYLHNRGVIHRDISPDTIVLQQQNRNKGDLESRSNLYPPGKVLPVLTDFGIVREITKCLFSASDSHLGQVLAVVVARSGKSGYAPSEQLQKGIASPSSDLYALAMTGLVLLTGKEPQVLLRNKAATDGEVLQDDKILYKHWQSDLSINPHLSAILDKMLAPNPGDRYQSASEVQAALRPLIESPSHKQNISYSSDAAVSPPVVTTPITKIPGFIVLQPTSSVNVTLSQVSTVVLREQFIQSCQWLIENLQLLLKQFWFCKTEIKLGGGTILLLLIATVMWRSTSNSSETTNEVWVSGAKLQQSEASNIITPHNFYKGEFRGSNTPTSLSKNNDSTRSAQPQEIELAFGTVSTTLQGNLEDSAMQPYIFRSSQAQTVTVKLEGSGVTMNVLSSDQQATNSIAYGTHSWTGHLTVDDRYLIQVLGSGHYSLAVTVSP